MSEFNYVMLTLAGVLALLFVVLLLALVKRTRGRGGFEPVAPLPQPEPEPEPEPIPQPIAERPAAVPQAESPTYSPWHLVSRTLANPDSSGGPLFRISLAPDALLPQWQPGAIAHVYCGPAREALAGGPAATAPAGDYIVCSLPDDGTVDLVVRISDRQGEDEGRRSHWICEEIEPGDKVALVLRDNPAFAPPPDEVPLILMGNATGIAGLQAHIKARPAGTRNWLIFGNRGNADDQVLAQAISEWMSTGHLERCDLVAPGDGPQKRLIIDQIADVSEPLLDWVLAGSAIYVCGSLPMGEDVDATLSKLLGTEVIEAMTEGGLYRRALF